MDEFETQLLQVGSARDLEHQYFKPSCYYYTQRHKQIVEEIYVVSNIAVIAGPKIIAKIDD